MKSTCPAPGPRIGPAGDYHEARAISTVRLIQGDCLDILPTLEPGSVDCVIMDPPYGVEMMSKRTKQRDGSTLTRAGGYCFADTPEYVRDVVVPALDRCRKIAVSVVVTPGTRNLWLYPPSDDMGCFFSAAGNGMGRWGFTCSQPILYYGKDPYQSGGLGCRPNSHGQTYPNDANKVNHPCAKPIRMWRWLVERASLPGMTVLDPFMGSGTTGVACYRTRRNFIGIEIDPAHYATAERRIEAERTRHPLFAGIAGGD